MRVWVVLRFATIALPRPKVFGEDGDLQVAGEWASDAFERVDERYRGLRTWSELMQDSSAALVLAPHVRPSCESGAPLLLAAQCGSHSVVSV